VSCCWWTFEEKKLIWNSVSREVASSLVFLLNAGYLLFIGWMAIGPAAKENAKKLYVLMKKISSKFVVKVKNAKRVKKQQNNRHQRRIDDEREIDVAELDRL
jgi:hypothetical protein